MKVQLRTASASDLDEILAIEQACFDITRRSSRRSMVNSLNSPMQQIWVASIKPEETEHGLAGVMILHHHVHTLRIYSLAVSAEFRGLGVGSKLLKHAHQLAVERRYDQLSLEADQADTRLVQWYETHGYQITDTLADYYSPGQHAVRMKLNLNPEKALSHRSNQNTVNLIVTDNPSELHLKIDKAQIISTQEYLTDPRFQNIPYARVFNLCQSYKYQSAGYYVSLLAEARSHRSIPSVSTIQDFQSRSIMRSMTDEMDEQIQKAFAGFDGKEITINLYFGHCIDKRFDELASRIYRMFPTPTLTVDFVCVRDKWVVDKISPLSLKKIDQGLMPTIQDLAVSFFNRKRFDQARMRNYAYDIAVLHDPEEADPPSNQDTLKRLCKIAEQMNIYMELITRNDMDRLSEFDALFIRTTTNVNHYTYQCSRKAYAEGLVVIDDPWSILRCANKVYLAERLSQEEILTPQTWILESSWLKNDRLTELPLPLIIKQPDSAFSKGVVKVTTHEQLKRTVQDLLKKSDLLLAQIFMPTAFDWRIGILDRKPLFACQYHMAEGHWQIVNWETKNKEDLWGAYKTFDIEDVPPAVVRTALKAANLIGDGLYGVDMKEIDGKAYVIEINDNPNIDLNIEDQVLKNELYRRLIQSFITRIKVARDISRLRL
jgi:glutathione synthase/RimK-type ligase-like ATP-grasp enzyme/ribosomal protein S18 acetylase RimI-like enzyme